MTKIVPPRFTNSGFKKTLVPSELYSQIMDEYNRMDFSEIIEDKIYDEVWGYNVGGISNLNPKEIFYYKDSISKNLYDRCYEVLTPILEEWCGTELEETWGYGIRSYTRNSILQLHRDKCETHIISCIIFVDEQANKKWPLDFFDHDLNHHKVIFNSGEMLLYESLCAHGRLTPFDGEYYRNMYFHWKPLFWDSGKYKDMKNKFSGARQYLSLYKT